MQNFHFELTMEPNDNYEKARKDIIKAFSSIQKLNPDQRQKLAIELFGLETVTKILRRLPHE